MIWSAWFYCYRQVCIRNLQAMHKMKMQDSYPKIVKNFKTMTAVH